MTDVGVCLDSALKTPDNVVSDHCSNMPPTTTLPSSSASASPSSTSQAASGTPPRKLSRGGGGADDGMYCYLNQMAQSGNGAARAMAEARLKLESSVRDGALEVGDCDCKTRLLHRVGSGSYGDVYLGLKENDNTEVLRS